MRAVDIIIKKRDGLELTRDEIDFFIRGYTSGEIPDYQASAWSMAVVLKGMTTRETVDLTTAMIYSGEIIDYSSLAPEIPIVLDKHSTGGVGDKTSLVVEPVVAACGIHVGKMSGRGLGFTGGTIDKMESIPGFRVDLSVTEFIDQLKKLGLVLAGQTAQFTPADGKLYALRDVSGTVPSLPLIASSIMSKKIAAGAHAILLDVKLGTGSFMGQMEASRQLAELMISIARQVGRKAVALLSDMNQPLGNAVGNTLEVKEALHTLQGGGPEDFRQHCLTAASHMLVLGKLCGSLEEGIQRAQTAINDGSAFEKFRQLVIAQGGDVSCIDDPGKLPKARLVETIHAPRHGFISQVNPRIIGETTVLLGAGRAMKGDPIDYAVGIIVHCKVGDSIAKGQPVFTIHANDPDRLSQARQALELAYQVSDEPVPPLPLFYGTIECE